MQSLYLCNISTFSFLLLQIPKVDFRGRGYEHLGVTKGLRIFPALISVNPLCEDPLSKHCSLCKAAPTQIPQHFFPVTSN